jgi:uncharacterized protein
VNECVIICITNGSLITRYLQFVFMERRNISFNIMKLKWAGRTVSVICAKDLRIFSVYLF